MTVLDGAVLRQHKPAVIFDIDGTLTDCAERRMHLHKDPPDWAAFNRDMGLDPPNLPILMVLRRFWSAGDHLILCTGREEVFRRGTELWLTFQEVSYHALYMRRAGDHRKDDVVKEEILHAIRADGYDPWLVIDDRQSVVDMWRRNGLTCLQCAEGKF